MAIEKNSLLTMSSKKFLWIFSDFLKKKKKHSDMTENVNIYITDMERANCLSVAFTSITKRNF